MYYFKPEYFFSNETFTDNEVLCGICSNIDNCSYSECRDVKIRETPEKSKDRLSESQLVFEQNSKLLKFVAKKSKIQEDLSPPYTTSYLDILDIKIKHLFTELHNLASLHDLIMASSKAGNDPSKYLNLPEILDNPVSGHFSRGYMMHIDKLSKSFYKLYSIYEKRLQSNSDVEYIIDILQEYNALMKLAQRIHEANTKGLINIAKSAFSKPKEMAVNVLETAHPHEARHIPNITIENHQNPNIHNNIMESSKR